MKKILLTLFVFLIIMLIMALLININILSSSFYTLVFFIALASLISSLLRNYVDKRQAMNNIISLT